MFAEFQLTQMFFAPPRLRFLIIRSFRERGYVQSNRTAHQKK
jgi:hypothetical protein